MFLHIIKHLESKVNKKGKRTEHDPWIIDFSFVKECISTESHYHKFSAFCTGFYGNQLFLIIYKITHIVE